MSTDWSNALSRTETTDRLPHAVTWSVRLLSLGAAAASSYLVWLSYQSGPVPGCSANSLLDCEHVMTSVWSRWLEIPVGILGGATYISIFVASWFVGPQTPARVRRAALWVLVLLTVMACGAALWFMGLQVFSIGKYCLYCMISHACGLALAAIFLPYAVATIQPKLRAAIPSALGLLGVMVLIGGQVLFPHQTFIVEEYSDVATEPTSNDNGTSHLAGSDDVLANDDTFLSSPLESLAGNSSLRTDGGTNNDSTIEASSDREPSDMTLSDQELLVDLPNQRPADRATHEVLRPTQQRMVRFYPSQPAINVYEYPHLGDPEAPHVLVEVMDYTCHHCRQMYGYLEQARERYGNDLTIVLRPIANNPQCNVYVARTHSDHDRACDYLKLALAVWIAEPEHFESFHNWLLTHEPIPSVERATEMAEQLVGVTMLNESLHDRRIASMMQDNHRLWKRVGGPLPLLFASSRKATGVPSSETELFQVLTDLIGEPNHVATKKKTKN